MFASPPPPPSIQTMQIALRRLEIQHHISHYQALHAIDAPTTNNTMAATSQYTPATLATLLKKLSVDDEDDEQILNHANNVLKKFKTDASALRTKLVALIKLERYDDAIKLLDNEDVKDKLDNLELERAYCLYKVGRIADAAEVAKKGAAGAKRKRGLQHVEAQSVYSRRSSMYRKAANIK